MDIDDSYCTIRYAMDAREAMRKIVQLRTHFDPKTSIRHFDYDDVVKSDLAGYILQPDGNVDAVRLIPFLIGSIHDIHHRLLALEKKIVIPTDRYPSSSNDEEGHTC